MRPVAESLCTLVVLLSCRASRYWIGLEKYRSKWLGGCVSSDYWLDMNPGVYRNWTSDVGGGGGGGGGQEASCVSMDEHGAFHYTSCSAELRGYVCKGTCSVVRNNKYVGRTSLESDQNLRGPRVDRYPLPAPDLSSKPAGVYTQGLFTARALN